MLEDITTVTPTSKETLTLYLEMQLQPIRSREVFFFCLVLMNVIYYIHMKDYGSLTSSWS